MISNLLSDNYNEIEVVAKRITGNHRSTAHEIINQTFIELSKKECPDNKHEFVKWFSRSMAMSYKCKNSAYNYSKTKETLLDYSPEIIDTDSLNEIEIGIESINQATKELIEVSSSMRKDRVITYINILELKKSLPPHEKYLFELYFENGLSTRDIAKQESEISGYNIGYQRINNMINVIKAKIKNIK